MSLLPTKVPKHALTYVVQQGLFVGTTKELLELRIPRIHGERPAQGEHVSEAVAPVVGGQTFAGSPETFLGSERDNPRSSRANARRAVTEDQCLPEPMAVRAVEHGGDHTTAFARALTH